ncbi:P-loop containing nucleoside triphosphate hydrolase protein [Amanita muscaria]
MSSGSSLFRSPSHAIAIPKPTLFFAIASDNADEVRKVLERGEVGPNESVGPQSALEFVLTNDQLMYKAEMVKILLAYGADPSVVKEHRARTRSITPDSDSESGTIDPATRHVVFRAYFLEKAEAAERQRTTAMIRRSSFRPITRVRYEIVGQDRVLEHLFKVLSIHTRQLSATPLVVLLSGPSGHGKSMLARKFGSLLEVPTHIVNMTTLRAPHELWQSHSMDPDNQTSTTSTLAKFLTKNEGKRCVVVLDEIEKTADEKVLWSLLMPWEHGRCSIEAGSPPIDVRNVVWIGTSNVGQNLVFEYQGAREQPQEPISKEEYTELMELVRPKMSVHLGTSVVSRVSAILPFVPFTAEERRVICFEALYSLAGVEIRQLASLVVDRVIENALAKFCPEEGARSLYRAISEQLAIHL